MAYIYTVSEKDCTLFFFYLFFWKRYNLFWTFCIFIIFSLSDNYVTEVGDQELTGKGLEEFGYDLI